MTKEELEKFLRDLDREHPLQEDSFQRWSRLMPTPEQPAPAHKLDTAPFDWNKRIAEAVAAERRFTSDVLAEIVRTLQADAADDLEAAVRKLTGEVSELRATLAEVRATLATERERKTLDMAPIVRREPLRAIG
jgi:hypothetical protein